MFFNVFLLLIYPEYLILLVFMQTCDSSLLSVIAMESCLTWTKQFFFFSKVQIESFFNTSFGLDNFDLDKTVFFSFQKFRMSPLLIPVLAWMAQAWGVALLGPAPLCHRSNLCSSSLWLKFLTDPTEHIFLLKYITTTGLDSGQLISAEFHNAIIVTICISTVCSVTSI